VSPKSRGRPPGRGRARTRPRVRRNPTYDDVLESTAVTFRLAEDPLAVEEIASMLAATWFWGTRTTNDEPYPDSEARVADLERVGAVEALLALRPMLEAPERRLVEAALGRLRGRQGVVEPPWADVMGDVELVDVHSVTEVLRDQDVWLLQFRYRFDRSGTEASGSPERAAGLETHALSVAVDRNRGGLIDAMALAHPGLTEEFLHRWRAAADDEPDLTMAAADAEEAARALRDALWGTTEAGPDSVQSVSVNLVPLLRARLHALPVVDDLEDEVEDQGGRSEPASADFQEIASEFAASPEAAHLPADVAEAAAYEFVRGTQPTDTPLRWSPIRVEVTLADQLPRHAILTDEADQAVPDVLRAFVRWAMTRERLPQHSIDETVAAVDSWEDEYRKAARDPTRYGWSKTMLIAMAESGVDLTDADAVARFIRKQAP
jgi:hypothetical protein